MTKCPLLRLHHLWANQPTQHTNLRITRTRGRNGHPAPIISATIMTIVTAGETTAAIVGTEIETEIEKETNTMTILLHHLSHHALTRLHHLHLQQPHLLLWRHLLLAQLPLLHRHSMQTHEMPVLHVPVATELIPRPSQIQNLPHLPVDVVIAVVIVLEIVTEIVELVRTPTIPTMNITHPAEGATMAVGTVMATNPKAINPRATSLKAIGQTGAEEMIITTTAIDEIDEISIEATGATTATTICSPRVTGSTTTETVETVETGTATGMMIAIAMATVDVVIEPQESQVNPNGRNRL